MTTKTPIAPTTKSHLKKGNVKKKKMMYRIAKTDLNDDEDSNNSNNDGSEKRSISEYGEKSNAITLKH